MNWNRIEGSWNQLKTRFNGHNSKHPSQKLGMIAMNKTLLTDNVHSTYKVNKERADKQLSDLQILLKKMNDFNSETSLYK